MASEKEESTGEVENFRRRRGALDITAVLLVLNRPVTVLSNTGLTGV